MNNRMLQPPESWERPTSEDQKPCTFISTGPNHLQHSLIEINLIKAIFFKLCCSPGFVLNGCWITTGTVTEWTQGSGSHFSNTQKGSPMQLFLQNFFQLLYLEIQELSILFLYIEAQLIYNVMSISAVQQSVFSHIHVRARARTHIHTHTHTHILFHVLFHYGLSQGIEYTSLCPTERPCCLSTLYVIVCIC